MSRNGTQINLVALIFLSTTRRPKPATFGVSGQRLVQIGCHISCSLPFIHGQGQALEPAVRVRRTRKHLGNQRKVWLTMILARLTRADC